MGKSLGINKRKTDEVMNKKQKKKRKKNIIQKKGRKIKKEI